MQLNPYLNFDGTTREAMEFYQKVLGGELYVQTFADGPMEASEEDRNRIMHARLDADGFTIMASDFQSGATDTGGENVSLSLQGTDLAALSGIFDGLADGGEVTMPMAEQFWGDTFGMLTDRHGIHWMVNVLKG